MLEIEHLNFGWLHSPPIQPACCHCLLIRDGERFALIDTGIGLLDIDRPDERIGPDVIAAAGFKFYPAVAAATQLDAQNIPRKAVTDIVLTHCDPDHTGGLSDFPDATVHVSAEELASVQSGNPRYSTAQFAHNPRWSAYAENDTDFFGLPARRVNTALDADIRLVPLFGHTTGHCGMAIGINAHWTFHIGDAYYLRDELDNPNHPIDELASIAAEDNTMRQASLSLLRNLSLRGAPLTMNGYHDTSELPTYVPTMADCA